MPEKRATKRKRTTAARGTAMKPAPPKKATAAPAVKAAAPKATATREAPPAPAARSACPRCGTPTFGPEQRIRAEGNRTVRYTVLVCERGHTFARPRSG